MEDYSQVFESLIVHCDQMKPVLTKVRKKMSNQLKWNLDSQLCCSLKKYFGNLSYYFFLFKCLKQRSYLCWDSKQIFFEGRKIKVQIRFLILIFQIIFLCENCFTGAHPLSTRKLEIP